VSPMTSEVERNILLQIAAGKVPTEDVDHLQEVTDELRQALSYLREIERFGVALSRGDLSAELRAKGTLAGGLKGLHANLRHLTWQTEQVAEGDFTQLVGFMGEFSTAFNTMVNRLRESRDELHKKNEELQKAYMEIQTTQLQLLQQEKMASVGQLAAGIAHEINTPLGFIAGNLTSLQRYSARMEEYISSQENALKELIDNPDARNEIVERMSALKKRLKLDFILNDLDGIIGESLDGANRVKGIVDDLKGFARLDESEDKDVSINDCMESALNLLRGTVDDRITLIKSYGTLPYLLCNPRLLNQAFMAIILNAFQAVSEGGEITLQTGSDGDRIFAVISDNGCGISADIIGRIFEPFFTTREVGKGTGLGLSVAYNIIKKHNGSIEVESRPGNGTTVTVSIPIISAPD